MERMKQIENTLQDLKCMLIEDGYTESNIVMRTLVKAQEQVKNRSIHYVSQQRGILESFRDWLNNTKTSDSNINNGDLDDFLEDYNCG